MRRRGTARRHVTAELLAAMVAKRMHLCAEMMSTSDQCHGAAVLKETPIVTSVGTGATLELGARAAKLPANGRFVQVPLCRQHVARRSATTSASVLVHDCRTCYPCFAQLTRAAPYHVLTGTAALFRMGKRLLVV